MAAKRMMRMARLHARLLKKTERMWAKVTRTKQRHRAWSTVATVAGVAAVLIAAAAIVVAARPDAVPARGDDTSSASIAPAPRAAKATSPKPVVTTEIVSASIATTGNAARDEEPVTISGCLQRDDDGFRLKNTEGADAPRSRSWKSGFLKKRGAEVAVIDAGNRLPLANYVGKRVMLTGSITDRKMRARGIITASGSCS